MQVNELCGSRRKLSCWIQLDTYTSALCGDVLQQLLDGISVS